MPIYLRPTITATFLDRVRGTPNANGFAYRAKYKEVGTSHSIREWMPVTFREFFLECQLVSYGLRKLGVRPKDRVGIFSSTRFEWPLSDMAILGASAITVPIYPSSSNDDLNYIVHHSECKVLFVEDYKLLQQAIQVSGIESIIVFDSTPIKTEDEIPEAWLQKVVTFEKLKEMGRLSFDQFQTTFESNLEDAKPDDLITICYTSGTTGTPKGVPLTHDNLMSVMEDCVSVFEKTILPDSEILVAFLPFSHIMGKIESMATYVFGWQEVFAENQETLAETFQEIRPTLIFAVPRIFEKIWARIQGQIGRMTLLRKAALESALKIGRNYWNKTWNHKPVSPIEKAAYELVSNTVFAWIRSRLGGRLKVAICGGAPLNRELGEAFEIFGIQILEGYGLTETCAPVCMNTPSHHRFGTVGRPLPEVGLKIAEDGEIWIRSRKNFSGYYRQPESASECFENGWFKTGDIGHIDSEGYVHITDRKKDIIITSGGKNVAPQKIEKLAKLQPWIHQIYVHGDRRNYLTALITLDQNAVLSYAKENGILYSEYSELIKNPKIESVVQKAVDRINGQLASFESIKRFMILPREFSVQDQEVTASQKIKRSQVYRHYQAQIERLYSS